MSDFTSALETLRANAFDVHNITPDLARLLVNALSEADVIYAFYPAGDETMLKGAERLREITNGSGRVNLRTMGVQVANSEQTHMVAAALDLIKQRKMGERQIATFREMLLSVQDGTDA